MYKSLLRHVFIFEVKYIVVSYENVYSTLEEADQHHFSKKTQEKSLFLKITNMMTFTEKFKVTFVTIYITLQELFELRHLLENNFG